MSKSLFSKSSQLFFVVILFSFYSCGTPTNTESTTEESKKINTENQQSVNKEANTEQENLDYAEKQQAANQAIAFYEFLKNGLHDQTSTLVDKESYENFAEAEWIELLKKEDATKGDVEKYAMQKNKIETTEDGSKIIKMTFEVTRSGKKYKEEMDLIKMNGAISYLITKIEFENQVSNTDEDDD